MRPTNLPQPEPVRRQSFLSLADPSLWPPWQNRFTHAIRESGSPLSTASTGGRQRQDAGSLGSASAAALLTDRSTRCGKFAPGMSPPASCGTRDSLPDGAWRVPPRQHFPECAGYQFVCGPRDAGQIQQPPSHDSTSAQINGESRKHAGKLFAQSLFDSQQGGTLRPGSPHHIHSSLPGFGAECRGHRAAGGSAAAPAGVNGDGVIAQRETRGNGRAAQHFGSLSSFRPGPRRVPCDTQQRRRRSPSTREPACALLDQMERAGTASPSAAWQQCFLDEKAAGRRLPPMPLLGKLRSNLSKQASLEVDGRCFRQENLTVDQLQRLYLRCQPLRWRVKLRQLFCQEAEHHDSGASTRGGSAPGACGVNELEEQTQGSASCEVVGSKRDANERGRSWLQQEPGEERDVSEQLADRKGEGEAAQAAGMGRTLSGRSAERSPDCVTAVGESARLGSGDKTGRRLHDGICAASDGVGSSDRDGATSVASNSRLHKASDALPASQLESQNTHSSHGGNAASRGVLPASDSHFLFGNSPSVTQPDAAKSIFGGSSLLGNSGGVAFAFSSSQTKPSSSRHTRTSLDASSVPDEAGAESLTTKSANTGVSSGSHVHLSSTKGSTSVASSEDRPGAAVIPPKPTLSQSTTTNIGDQEDPSSRGLLTGSPGAIPASANGSPPVFGRLAPASTAFGVQQDGKPLSRATGDSTGTLSLVAPGNSQTKLGTDKGGIDKLGGEQANSSVERRGTSAGRASPGVVVEGEAKGEKDGRLKATGDGSAEKSPSATASGDAPSDAAPALPWWQQNVGKACLVQVEDDGFAPDEEQDEGDDGDGVTSATTEKSKHAGATPAAGSVSSLAAFQPPAAGSSGSIFGSYSPSKSTPAPAATATSIFGSSSGVFGSASVSGSVPESAPSKSMTAAVPQSVPCTTGSGVPSLFVFGGGATAGAAFSGVNTGSLFGSSGKENTVGSSLFGGSVPVKPGVASEGSAPGRGEGEAKQPGTGGSAGASPGSSGEAGTGKKAGLFVFGSTAAAPPSSATGSGGGKRAREGREDDGGQPATKSVFGAAHGGGVLFGSVTSGTPAGKSATSNTLGTNSTAENSSGPANPFGFSRTAKEFSGTGATLSSSLFGNRSATPVFGVGADGNGINTPGASGSSLFGSSSGTTSNPFRFGDQSLTASTGSSVFGSASNSCSSLFGGSSTSATGGSSGVGLGSASSHTGTSTTSFFSFSSTPSSMAPGGGTSAGLGGRTMFGNPAALKPFSLPSGAGGDSQASSQGVTGRTATPLFSGGGPAGGSQEDGSGLSAQGSVVRRPRLAIKRTKN